MMKRLVLALALTLPLAAAPRISFVRTVPPPHPLAGGDVVVIYAIADTPKIDSFLETFLTRATRSDALRVSVATDHLHTLIGEQPDAADLAHLRHLHPADAYVGINRFSCVTSDHSGEVSTRDSTGTRVKQRLEWRDAICRARIDVVDPATGRRMLSFEVKGEGTSPRDEKLTADDRDVALEQATHFAATQAAEAITPRLVRQSVELEEGVADLDRALALIDAGRLAAARGIWEKALERTPASAPLHYNVAALSEAIGEIDVARKHYEEAQRLAPKERRYRIELAMFRVRSQ
jgi:tetratricopeptide (TPR) repeat protein